MTIEKVDLSRGASFRNGFPHEFFRWLREYHPVYWHEPTEATPDGEGFWVISRYDDVAYVQRNPELFSSEVAGDRTGGGTSIKDERSAGILLNHTDDPKHRRLRALISQGFTPKAIAQLQGELRNRVRTLLDGVPDPSRFDFVSRVAREVPLQMICAVLGVPQDERAMLIDWVDRGLATESHSIIAPEYTRKIREFARSIIADKRRNPADDILSKLVLARFEEDGSALQDAELVAFFALLFPAGAETTRSALAGAVLAFIEHPEQFTRLRSDPTLMRSAVEEIVRWTTPSIYKRRTAVRDTEIAGTRIRRGDKVTFWEMSANRDERAWEDPFSFDVGRWPNKHLGFGAGVHFCLGASLARMEIQVVLEELMARFAGFDLVGEVAWMPNNRLLGLTRLEIRANPARGERRLG